MCLAFLTTYPPRWHFLPYRRQHFLTTYQPLLVNVVSEHPLSTILVIEISKNYQFMTPYHPSSNYIIYGWLVPRHHTLPMGRSFSVFIRFFVFSMKTFWHIATFFFMFLICFALSQVISPLNPKWDKWIVIDLLKYALLFLLHFGITKQVN